MNVLTDKLPDKVEIDGREYQIRTDFRTSILFELLVQNDELQAIEKIMPALELYYPVIPNNYSEAVDKILWFYACGKKQKSKKTDKDVSTARKNDMAYSFEHDADYILAAFMQQYGIDLLHENMHWWRFRALFKALTADTEFVKIMGYRSVEITGNMSKEQRSYYTKMKRIHALPISDKEREMDEMLEEALRNGEDISQFL